MSRARGTLHLEFQGAPPRSHPGLAVPTASAQDLTAIKLSAIAGRGLARDFWDLHELLSLRGVPLSEAIADFERKFVAQDPGSVVRSLAYFGDADAEPLPRGLTAVHWERIKADFRRWVAQL